MSVDFSLKEGWKAWGTVQCPEPPPCRNHHDDLLEQAKAMLATREKRLPTMVLRKEISGEAAERELVTFRKLVADLEWIEAAKDGGYDQPIPIDEADRKAIRAALDDSIETIGQLFDDAGHPVPERLSDQAHYVIALRWNYDPERGPIGAMGEMHRNAILTGKCRHQARLQQKRSDAS